VGRAHVAAEHVVVAVAVVVADGHRRDRLPAYA
jgi:hypothetical protein